MNVFDKFWGPCEVAETLIKRYMEGGDKKCEFISVEKDLTGDFFSKHKFASMPKYFIVCVNIKTLIFKCYLIKMIFISFKD